MLEQPLLFTGFSYIQFFNSPSFPNTVSQDTFDILPRTVQCLHDLWDTIDLLHWLPSTSHPTLTRETEDFPKGDRHLKDVLLPTFLDYLLTCNLSMAKSWMFLLLVISKRLVN